jgi:UDP-N-acetylglucosamine 4,6-dehydratase
MITASDAMNTYDLGSYYAILPVNPYWEVVDFIKNFKAKLVPKGFSYNSNQNEDWETVESLRALIKEYVDSSFKV